MPAIILPRQSTTTTSDNCPSTLSGGAIAGIVLGTMAGTLLLEWLIRACFWPGAPLNKDPEDGGVVYSSTTTSPASSRRTRRYSQRGANGYGYRGSGPDYVEYVEKSPVRGARVTRSRRGSVASKRWAVYDAQPGIEIANIMFEVQSLFLVLLLECRVESRLEEAGRQSRNEDPELARIDTLSERAQIRPILLFITIILAWVMTMTESVAMATRQQESHWRYSTVTGYFLQDDEGTDSDKFDYVSTNFGLINRTYDHDQELDARHEEEEGGKTQWQRFEHQIRAMNIEVDPNTQYKVLYLGRHGQGFHNVAESWYGSEAWDCYWSLLDGNETMTWDDARLTEIGKSQAQTANNAWRRQIENKIPFPETFYLVRETLGIHTCDRRSSKTAIVEEYPEYIIEDNFSENDELWEAEWRESDSARNARIKKFLDDVFSSTTNNNENDNNDKSTQFISITAHSGAIISILEVIGHRKFDLQTGGVIPVLVKAERVAGKEPEQVIEPPTGIPDCRDGAVKAAAGGVSLQVREVGVDV
ncbi:hypothetical protein UA08_02853 [Talaromyces atroroseus]|uniref:Phosphomutase-like protein 3 n=1 Tax=Talaromyces atroroseus TaxID=1441469 RepID=A0A225ALR7_TALAT|nr:hypothetical protein UA08_02853 [Talaromyces atroroseus]OKL61850.1 hypothetical protein UA08_02853 [Talaromyces atroroseus]